MSGYSYVGEDRFYGIPARDLTQQEFDDLTPDQQRVVRESPAYSESVKGSPLASLKREDLEARAEEVGVVEPGLYGNKTQLIDAIEQQLAGGDTSSEEG